MNEKNVHQMTILLEKEDLRRIAEIKQKTGISSKVGAIRFALRRFVIE